LHPPARAGIGIVAAIIGTAVVGAVILALRPSPGPSGVAAGNEGAAAVASRSPDRRPSAPAATARAAEYSHGTPGTSTPPKDDTERPRGGRPAEPATLTGYAWPVTNARITNGYGKGSPGNFEVDGVTFHDGIDISSFCGAPILAAHDGTVLNAGRHHEAWLGWVGDLGPYRDKITRKDAWGGQAISVVIDDGNGYRSVYAHLARKAVSAGDEVRAGDVIGYEGASGNATGCHLHFSIYSPEELRTLDLEKKVAEKTLLPPREIARINPFLVLPPPEAARITWGWGVTPTAE
jgi:murein DD-endopeptidase MepM/ murein hydrolase activator NlpD